MTLTVDSEDRSMYVGKGAARSVQVDEDLASACSPVDEDPSSFAIPVIVVKSLGNFARGTEASCSPRATTAQVGTR